MVMYLAIDIGGTKTLVANFSADGQLMQSVRFDTPSNYPAFLSELTKACFELPPNDKFKYCVVGAPGRIDRSNGTVIAFGNLAWENTPLQEDIERITGVKTIVENDANLAGLSEAVLIKHGYNKVLYVTISTGIGGIVIEDGKIDPDFADIEFGHMMFEHDGRLQAWQDFASGKAIFKKYGVPAKDLHDPQAWYEVSRNIALGLTNVLANTTPEVVIFGGGVGTHFDKFADQLHESMMIMGSKMVAIPPIRKALRAEEAVLYGCYEFARQIPN